MNLLIIRLPLSLPILPQGLTLLLHGPPGTGKTLAAEAIGYEVGKPLKVVNCGELLSKWVGESSKNMPSSKRPDTRTPSLCLMRKREFGQRTSMRYMQSWV